MTDNYAVKYAGDVDERIAMTALTQAAVNQEYDWTGVDTVTAYSLPVAELNDYKTTGTSRYGTPEDLGASRQTLTISQDKSFTFIIDKRDFDSAQMALEAGKALKRQMDEVVIPAIEKNRITAMVDGADEDNIVYGDVIDQSNAYDAFLDAVNTLTDKQVAVKGCVALITPRFYKAIRQDASFMRSGDVSQNMLVSGQVGMVDGIPLILAPSTYFPKNIAFVIAHPGATVAPVKLAEYKIHDNPPGMNGWLVEGRFLFDAFVLEGKANGLFVYSEGDE